MRRGPLHSRGADDRCTECGEPWLCPAAIKERDMTHQVAPSATVLAHDLEHQLRVVHQALTALERDLRQSARTEQRADRARAHRIAVAIKHLEAAMEALDLASGE